MSFQQILSKCYSFEFLHNTFGGYYNLGNKSQEETNMSGDPYPWLEQNDPLIKLTNRQIIESIESVMYV